MQGWFIFVCDRGFVTVGEAKLEEGLALFWRLEESATIRRWGTSDGLAELQHGPKDGTQIDQVCTRSLPFRSVIDMIHVTKKGAEAWAAEFRRKARS